MLNRIGRLPWRAAEEFGNLRRAFEGFAHDAPYAPADVALFAPVVSHYIQDAQQPFHASANYDGQLTGNNGIHARFERDLFERFAGRLTVTPQPAVATANVRDAAFDMLLTSYQQVDAILKADADAAAGRDSYDDAYFEAFFARVRPALERRIADSITATAAVIAGAWESAGRPVVKLQGARPVQKIKRP